MDIIKPRLKKYKGEWLCESFLNKQSGATPLKAYNRWLKYYRWLTS